MKKLVIFLLIFTLIPVATASIIFEDWVNNQETFKAGDHTFYAQYIESVQKLSFKMDGTGGTMFMGECESRDNIQYCFEDVIFPQIKVKIESLEPDISIERTFSTKTPFLKEKMTITVTLTNNGDKGATNVKYTDPYPGTLKVFSDTNAGKWQGSLSAGEEETFTYSIMTDDIVSFKSIATLSYIFAGKEKTKKSDPITIEVQKPFALSHTISKAAADKNEVVDYNLTITNNDETSELDIKNLQISFPSKIKLVNTPIGLKEENNELIFKGTLEKKKSKSFAIKIKSPQVGKFTIKTSINAEMGGRDFKEDIEKQLSVGLSYILPILNITDTVKSNSPYDIHIAIKNYGDDEIKSVNIKAESDLFTNINESKNIAAGSTYDIIKKTMTAPYTEEDKKHNIKVSGSYISPSGRTYEFEKSAQLTIKAAPKIIKIIKEFNQDEFYPGDEIKVTVKIKNQKSTAIEGIDVSDIFPQEIRSSLMGDVIGNLDKLGPNEEKKMYSYSVVIPEDYKEDEIEFKTNLNTNIDGELIILKRIDNLPVITGEKPEEEQETEEQQEEDEEETSEEDINVEFNIEDEETKENFFKKIIGWIANLFKKD
jgi:uncharacterized repeat protein (TIGR01451 family)